MNCRCIVAIYAAPLFDAALFNSLRRLKERLNQISCAVNSVRRELPARTTVIQNSKKKRREEKKKKKTSHIALMSSW